MNEPIKIALTGRIGSGKDEVAKILMLEHDFRYPLAFGDSLKYYAHKIFRDVPSNPKPRKLYQFMHRMREFDPDVWVKHLAVAIEVAEDSRSTKGIVITDVRAENEYEWVKANGFTVVKVIAPKEIRLERAKGRGDDFDPSDLEHESEQAIDGFKADYEIVNDGTIAELKPKINEIIRRLAEGAGEE